MPIDAEMAAAFCGCAALAATFPIVGSGAVPTIVRTVLALTLAPLIAPDHIHAASQTEWAARFLGRALPLVALGATCGLGATMVANAAGAAGAAIDAAISASPTGVLRLGSAGGPVGLLYSLGFALALFGTGTATRIIAVFANAARAGVLPVLHPARPGDLATASFTAALGLAASALFSQAIATLGAGMLARLLPRTNGLLAASALGALLVLFTLLAGAQSLFPALADLARESLGGARNGLP